MRRVFRGEVWGKVQPIFMFGIKPSTESPGDIIVEAEHWLRVIPNSFARNVLPFLILLRNFTCRGAETHYLRLTTFSTQDAFIGVLSPVLDLLPIQQGQNLQNHRN